MMTDRERDAIDEDVEEFIRVCNEKALKSLRAEANRSNRQRSQLSQHQNNVIDLIQTYLKSVCDIHSQQKAIRIKRAVEKQRLLRLGHIVSRDKTQNETKPPEHKHLSSSNKKNERSVVNESRERSSSGSPPESETVVKTPITSLEDNDDTYQQLELNKHEMQAFEEENKHLFNQMNSLSDEVKDIEVKVVEIARLQEIFTENVLKQEIDLNKLSDLTISSTENIHSGNQQLREAMKKNAGFRVWILFFITTLAFTILFLDWYND